MRPLAAQLALALALCGCAASRERAAPRPPAPPAPPADERPFAPTGQRPAREPGPPRSASPDSAMITVSGRLTNEGIECPVLRGHDGRIYTLAGSIAPFAAGDEVCVKGRVVEVSACMQGVTLALAWIGVAATCP